MRRARPARALAVSTALALSGWTALAASYLPAGFTGRPLVVGAFLLLCPGAASMRFWPVGDRLERAVLSVAVSAGLAVAVVEVQLFAHLWQPRATLAVLAAFTTAAVVLGRRRRVIAEGGET